MTEQGQAQVEGQAAAGGQPAEPLPWLEELAAAPDRRGARPLHRRPGSREEGGGDRHPQPLAARPGAGGDPRGDPPQQHHHDRPDRASGRPRSPAGSRGSPARRSSRWRRRSSPRWATSGATWSPWCATWWTPPSTWCAASGRTTSTRRPRRAPRSGCSTCCCLRRPRRPRRRPPPPAGRRASRGRSARTLFVVSPKGDVTERRGGRGRKAQGAPRAHPREAPRAAQGREARGARRRGRGDAGVLPADGPVPAAGHGGDRHQPDGLAQGDAPQAQEAAHACASPRRGGS